MQSNEVKPVIWHAPSILSKKEYLWETQRLIKESIIHEPTLVLHSPKEILNRYNHSIIAILGNSLIANTSIYPTHMKPLDSISWINIWECGSTVVEIWYRDLWIWKTTILKAMELLWPNYDALVCATINHKMENIRKKLWFEYVKFPKEYYEEWKIHISPKLEWWAKEFENRAKCLMNFSRLSESKRKLILDLLDNQDKQINQVFLSENDTLWRQLFCPWLMF